MGEADNAFRRRLERGAELRSYRGAGISAEEEAQLEAAEEDERQKRRKVDDAKRVEYLIRDAMAQGKFDNLKYSGKPIPGMGEAYDPDWWVKGLIQRENISGLGPKAILLRTEDAELDARLDAQFTEKQVRDILKDFNARVVDARRQLQGGPPVVTKTRDIDVEVSRWHQRRTARAKAASPEPQPEARRTWWQRLWNGTG
ncbi:MULTISPECIES: J-domain-containing protein [unclassified Pseudarthrobacter]|uniref:DnaJ family domain-containing protein n=1 Tax=unclassified Pseudarthrobacter TaxID=2647000 RepID=UPI0030787C01